MQTIEEFATSKTWKWKHAHLYTSSTPDSIYGPGKEPVLLVFRLLVTPSFHLCLSYRSRAAIQASMKWFRRCRCCRRDWSPRPKRSSKRNWWYKRRRNSTSSWSTFWLDSLALRSQNSCRSIRIPSRRRQNKWRWHCYFSFDHYPRRNHLGLFSVGTVSIRGVTLTQCHYTAITMVNHPGIVFLIYLVA